MGILERALAEISAEWTWRRIETKWEDNFSPASGERRGAQRLHIRLVKSEELKLPVNWERGHTICNS